MSPHSSSSGACGCQKTPCTCACSSARAGMGCVGDFSPPRPMFFDGQLITADDLNAMMTYFRTRDAMLAKLVGGWGILGGMRLLQASARSYHFFLEFGGQNAVSGDLVGVVPNPQITAGSSLRISAGAAIDNAGRILTLGSDRVIDILELAKGVGFAPTQLSCAEVLGTEPCADNDWEFLGASYWVIAEAVDAPSRPSPQFSAGGPCDPAPSCGFSRQIENVRIRLVKDLPGLYFVHGCLDPIAIPEADVLLGLIPNESADASGLVTPGIGLQNVTNPGTSEGGGSTTGLSLNTGTANEWITSEYFANAGMKLVPNVFEWLNALALNTCCAHPVVALGRVVLATDVPEEFKTKLGDESKYYLFIDDGFPYRRTVMNGANVQTAAQIVLATLLNKGGGGPEAEQ